MGGSTRLRVSLEHQHLSSGSGAKGSAAETTDAAADHNHIDPVLHPTQPMGVIIVIPACWRWVAAG